MDILYYVETFPKLSESFILNEIYELEQQGHNVAVFAHKRGSEDILHDEFSELEAETGYADTPGLTDFPDLFSSTVLSPRVWWRAYYRLNPVRLLAAFHRCQQCCEFIEDIGLDIDLVHNHFATPPNYAARYVSSYYDVPHTVTTHAFDLYDDVNEDFLQAFLNGASYILTISEYNRDHIQKYTNTPTSVIRAGIRPEKFSPNEYKDTVDNRILSVARLDEKKGLTDAIEAVSEIVDRGIDVEYHIVGKGPLRNTLESKIAAHGLEDTVSLLGHIDDKQLACEYDEAACFLLPSVITESGDRDGIPVVLMESMAVETPPVSTTISGIPELVDDGENGLLAPPGDVQSIADHLETLLESPDLQCEFGQNGRERISNEFNAKYQAVRLSNIFKSVVQSPPARSDVSREFAVSGKEEGER